MPIAIVVLQLSLALQLRQELTFLRCVIVLLALTNAFTLSVAIAAMWLRDGERLRARARFFFGEGTR